MTVYTVVLIWGILHGAHGETRYCVPAAQHAELSDIATDVVHNTPDLIPRKATLYAVRVLDDRCSNVSIPSDAPKQVTVKVR